MFERGGFWIFSPLRGATKLDETANSPHRAAVSHAYERVINGERESVFVAEAFRYRFCLLSFGRRRLLAYETVSIPRMVLGKTPAMRIPAISTVIAMRLSGEISIAPVSLGSCQKAAAITRR